MCLLGRQHHLIACLPEHEVEQTILDGWLRESSGEQASREDNLLRPATPEQHAPLKPVRERTGSDYLLAIKQSTLRSMRRDGRLEAGAHWIYATGKAGGPVTYNLPAIRQTLAERTIQMVELEAQRRAALRKEKQDSIETFSNAPSVRAGS